jgi:hypothetical protein
MSIVIVVSNLEFCASCDSTVESIDALARCINKFKGGVIMVSHDMRLISQVRGLGLNCCFSTTLFFFT